MDVPSEPTRLRADALRNRDRLVTVARRLFASSGDAVTMDGIAQAAGVGIGTLYRHFPTRIALVEAVYHRELTALENGVAADLASSSALPALRRWMNRYAHFVAAKRPLQQALSVMPAAGGAYSETRERVIACIARFLVAGARDGSIRPNVEADDVGVCLHAIAVSAATSSDTDQPRRLFDLLLNGIRPT